MLALVHSAPETKTCTKCGEEKPLSDYYRNAQGRKGRASRCKPCSVAAVIASRKANPGPHKAWLEGARGILSRAKKTARIRGRAFDLHEEDICIPEFCPVLGIPLERGIKKLCDSSPSIDRIDSSRGYVRGNVAIISLRANMIKNCGTAEEHERIAAWMRMQGAA